MTVRIINADVLAGLYSLPDCSVHCVVTSPPYFRLRSYLPDDHPNKPFEIGLEESLDGHIEKLVEVFREVRRVLRHDGVLWLNYGDCYAGIWGNQGRKEERGGQRAVNAPMMQQVQDTRYITTSKNTGSLNRMPGLKAKDLCLVPFRLAIALQSDGWYVRSRLPWLKPNGMPSSVEDRPGTAVEEWFLLTKSPTYFYDSEAIKIIARYPAGPNAPDKIKSPTGQGMTRRNGYPAPAGWDQTVGEGGHGTVHRHGRRRAETNADARPPGTRAHKGLSLARGAKNERSQGLVADASYRQRAGFNDRWEDGGSDGMRAFRQVDLFFSETGDVRGVIANSAGDILALHMATQPYAEAHFATFGPDLIKPLILAGTSAKGCRANCGAPYERIIKKTFVPQPDVSAEKGKRQNMDASRKDEGMPRGSTKTETVGWESTCGCNAEIAPCTVLDPFSGAGTVALVSDRLQRNAIGIELNPDYAEQSRQRLAKDRTGGLLDMMEGADASA